MIASWMDALLGLPAPRNLSVAHQGVMPCRIGPARRKKKLGRIQNGACRACGAPVFWSQDAQGRNRIVEATEAGAFQHRCHGVVPEDFKDLTNDSDV